MGAETVGFDRAAATSRQLLLFALDRFDELEAAVADVKKTIEDLKAAVWKEQEDDKTLQALHDEAIAARDQALAELAEVKANSSATAADVAAKQAELDELNAAVQEAVELLGMNDLPEAEEPAVEEAPVEEAPVEEAPVEEAPVEEAAQEQVSEESVTVDVPVQEAAPVQPVPEEEAVVHGGTPVSPVTEYRSAPAPVQPVPEEELTEFDEGFQQNQ